MNVEKVIFQTLDFSYSGEIEFVKKDGVYVSYNKGKCIISNKDTSCFTRGLSLMVKKIREGKESFVISETPSFETRGLQLDLSRNGVMRVSAIKLYLNYMACMGLNSLILYMEDVYKLPGYPFFGYMRGAYSHEELKEIDDYAYELGIEVIPHIQTLGHMSQYFKWREAANIRNNSDTFLCGDAETYKFIEVMIKTMRKCFRSGKIHIGCDEAPMVAQGRYLIKNGQRNPIDVMNEHIAKVIDICKRYDFEALMYSDLYFSLNSGIHYDPEIKFSEDFIKSLPDASLVYWDYGRTDEAWYEKVIKVHQTFRKNVIFAGGIWGWLDILPRYTYTIDTFIPGIRASIKNNIKSVYGTIWGDDGCECNKMYELFFSSVLSEYCFKGYDCELEDVYNMCEFLFGIKKDFFTAVSEASMPWTNTEAWGYSDTFYGKGLFYTDIFYNLTNEIDFYNTAKERYIKAKKIIEKSFEKSQWKDFEQFAIDIYSILIAKSDIIVNIRSAYEKDNRAYLTHLVQKELPKLKEKYISLMELWQKMWMQVFKPFGWECINSRLAAVIARIDYAAQRINEYLSGKIGTIEELNEPIIIADTFENRRYADLITGSKIL